MLFRLLSKFTRFGAILPVPGFLLWMALSLMMGVSMQAWGQYQAKLSAQQCREELEVLCTAIREIHPAPDFYWPKDSMESQRKALLANCTDSMPTEQWHILLRKLVAHLACGHTVVFPSKTWYEEHRKSPSMFPVEVCRKGNELYVLRSLRDSLFGVYPGMPIVKINGDKASALLAEMDSIHSRDGYSYAFVEYSVPQLFRTYLVFLKGMQATYSVLGKTREGKDTLMEWKGLKKGQEKKPATPDSSRYSLVEKMPLMQWYVDAKDSMMLLDIQSFQHVRFKRFYRKGFRYMKEHEIKKLVVDVRGNGGGYFPNAINLLSYLSNKERDFYFYRPKHRISCKSYLKWDFFSRITQLAFSLKPDVDTLPAYKSFLFRYKPKPKRVFNGEVVVLTDGGSFSLSSFFASYMKHVLGTHLMGTETGGGDTDANAVLMPVLSLPHSGIRITMPYYHVHHRWTPQSSGHGVIPQDIIRPSLPDVVEEKDIVLDKARLYLNRAKKSE